MYSAFYLFRSLPCLHGSHCIVLTSFWNGCVHCSLAICERWCCFCPWSWAMRTTISRYFWWTCKETRKCSVAQYCPVFDLLVLFLCMCMDVWCADRYNSKRQPILDAVDAKRRRVAVSPWESLPHCICFLKTLLFLHMLHSPCRWSFWRVSARWTALNERTLVALPSCAFPKKLCVRCDLGTCEYCWNLKAS